MWFDINHNSGTPIYIQLATQVHQSVASGALSPGQRLPSVRKLASQLTINPNTVAKAYRELENEGILITRQGRGTFVAEEMDSVNAEDWATLLKPLIKKLVLQSLNLDISEEQLLQQVRTVYREVKNDE